MWPFPSPMLICFQTSQNTQIYLPKLQNSVHICLIIWSIVTVFLWNVNKKVNFHQLVLTVMHQHPSKSKAIRATPPGAKQAVCTFCIFLLEENQWLLCLEAHRHVNATTWTKLKLMQERHLILASPEQSHSAEGSAFKVTIWKEKQAQLASLSKWTPWKSYWKVTA